MDQFQEHGGGPPRGLSHRKEHNYPYQRILVPLDGSALAEQVLPYVRILATALKTPIELLSAFSPVSENMADPAHGLFIDRIATSFREQAHTSPEGYARSLSDTGVAVTSSAHEGDPATHIVEAADRQPGTLIAMSTHGRSGIGRWVMGSVTDKVLHATDSAMLIIRARPVEGFSPDAVATRSERWATVAGIDNVVLPVDGSAVSERALPHAAATAKALGKSMRPLRVTSSQAEEAGARAYLGQVSQKLVEGGASVAEGQVLRGDPASVIVDFVQRQHNSLIAMPTRGHSRVAHWVMGSVTDRVVRYSGAPVLVVRG